MDQVNKTTYQRPSCKNKWLLGKECGIPTIQHMDHMKLKRKKDQRVVSSVLLRKGNKIIKKVEGGSKI